MRDAAMHKANYTAARYTEGVNMLGKMLRDWRKRNSYTLEDVAAEIGTSKGHLSDMERGLRPISSRWIEKISASYGVPQTEIIGLAEIEPEPNAVPGGDGRAQVLAEYLALTDEARQNILSVMRQMPKRPKSDP